MVAEGVQGLRRQGVDSVGADQGLDIEHVAVGRILHACGSPQQALRACPGFGQGFPWRRAQHRQIELIGDLGAGDGRLAAQRLQRLSLRIRCGDTAIDLLVDLGIDAAEKEACYAAHPRDIAASGHERLQAPHVRFRYGLVGVQAEQQGDVDVDAFADQGADGRRARVGSGHLDHDVRPVHRPPQPSRLGDRGLSVHREIGRDLKADVTVRAVQLVVDRPEQVRRRLDVGDRQSFVEVHGLRIGIPQRRPQAIVIIAALPDRLFEDRGVGRHPLQAVFADQTR